METGTSSSSSSGLVKAKSETLAEALKSSSLDFSNGGGSSHVIARTLSSPSHSGSSNSRRNTHIRKAKSAHPALDLARLTGGAALSRASSASLGLSFSFTGFAVPHEEIIASCSNDDISEDIEAATSSVVKLQAEPTFPIYLKVTISVDRSFYGKHGKIDLYDTLYLSAGTDGDMYLNHQHPKVHRNILDFAAIG